MTTPNLSLPELAASQSQPHVTLNAALRRLDALVQLTVTSISDAPPGSPADGDRYIVGSSPSGAWVGHEHEVAAYIGTAWVFWVPDTGWLAFVKSLALAYVYGAGSPLGWEPLVPEGGGGGGGGDGDSSWVTPDSPPATADAKDDEFNGTTLDAKWTADATYSSGGAVVASSVNKGAFVIEMGTAAYSRAWTQAVSGSAWKFRMKVQIVVQPAATIGFDSAVTGASVFFNLFAAKNSTTKGFGPYVGYNDNGIRLGYMTRTGATRGSSTYETNNALVAGTLAAFGSYLELEYDGTNFYARHSLSGQDGTFVTFASPLLSAHVISEPDKIGFCLSNEATARKMFFIIDWFRKVA